MWFDICCCVQSRTPGFESILEEYAKPLVNKARLMIASQKAAASSTDDEGDPSTLPYPA